MLKIVIPQNTDATFSPDGQYMAVSGEESFVRIWDVNDWVELPSLRHEHKVYSIAFSPNSQYLVTASWDKTAIWKVPDFQEIARVTDNEDVRAITFSPDGKYLATANADGTTTIRLWQPDDLISEACNRLVRNLTVEEWKQFFGDEPYRQTCPNIKEGTSV